MTKIMTLLAASLATAPGDAAGHLAPEQLPPVTGRWEDVGQREVFVIEGERYACRLATRPARILSLTVDGQELLGEAGVGLVARDAAGRDYRPAPDGVVPKWNIWRRKWVPAANSAARLNVWNASPYYWDVHLLDIPLMSAEQVSATVGSVGEVLRTWTFDDGPQGWEALHNVTFTATEGRLVTVGTGDDPYGQSPPVDLPPQVMVHLRVRSGGGGAAFYYAVDRGGFTGDQVVLFNVPGDGQWHDLRVPLKANGRITRLRFDPPGTDRTTEIDELRVLAFEPGSGDGLTPMRGELVCHAYPDQLRLQLRCSADEGAPLPAELGLEFSAGFEGGGPLWRLGPTAWLGPERSAPEADRWRGPGSDLRWVIRPAGEGAPTELFRNDLDPLSEAAVTVEGGHWLGYDQASGLYRVKAAVNAPSLGFEPSYRVPGRRVEVGLALAGDARDRSLLLRTESPIGNLEAAVATDLWGFPLAAPAFVAKNFAGELEEPDDSAYGDSYYPVSLGAGEQTAFRMVHLNQNWGDHPLQQVSSIRFFNIYWHLSTGASETTCFTHDRLFLNGAWVRIPDFRPLSGPFWPGQPQHDCQQWPGFLSYNGTDGLPLYDRTVFTSISPNLTRFAMFFHTGDQAATMRLDVTEIPQRDEMRCFVRVRCDWQQPVTVTGDARQSFRWLNMNEKGTPASLLWLGPDGSIAQREVSPTTTPLVLGELLAADSPVAGSHGVGEAYHAMVLVRSFAARLGGVSYTQPSLGAQFRQRGGDWWLSVPAETLRLEPGDFIEAEVMLMPHGAPAEPTFKPLQERERFGPSGPRVTAVAWGEKLADFPARIRARDEVVSATLTGGFDTMPLIAEGFSAPGVPLLWQEGVWQDQQRHGGDGYQVEGDGAGGYRFVFVYPTRTGQSHPLMVTRAECSGGIARLVDHNGFLVIQAVTPGRFALKAPAPFAPGRNAVVSGAAAISFAGEAGEVRQIPLGIHPTGGQTEVEVSEYRPEAVRLQVEGGPARLVVGGLRPGAAYQIAVNGQSTSQVASGGTLTIEVTSVPGRVELVRR